MADVGTLGTIASVIAGFGSAMLIFRIQSEQQMNQEEAQRLPWADCLLIVATLVALLLVLLPLAATTNRPGVMAYLPAAGCAAAMILMAGYILAILAHYGLLLGKGRSSPRANPEPAERIIVLATGLVALLTFLWDLWHYSLPTEL